MKSNNVLFFGVGALGAAALAYFLVKKIKKQQEVEPLNVPNTSNTPITNTPVSTGNTNTVNIPVGNTGNTVNIPTTGNVGGSIGGIVGGAVANPTLVFSFSADQKETLENGNALSQRAKNPGAVFWDGSSDWQGMDKSKTQNGQIVYFTDTEKGIRCGVMVLRNYKRRHNIDNLLAVFNRYAPSGHGNNNPKVYAETVANYLGIGIDTKIDLENDKSMLAAVAYYIHRVEAGYFWVPRERFIYWANQM